MDDLPTEIESLILEYKRDFEEHEREVEIRMRRVSRAIDKGLRTVGILPITSDLCLQAVMYTSWLFGKLDIIDTNIHRIEFFNQIKDVESKLTLLHMEGILERAVQHWNRWDPLSTSMN